MFIIATGIAATTGCHLELWVTSHPKGQRVEDVVAFSIEMLARYAPEIGSWTVDKTSPLNKTRAVPSGFEPPFLA